MIWNGRIINEHPMSLFRYTNYHIILSGTIAVVEWILWTLPRGNRFMDKLCLPRRLMVPVTNVFTGANWSRRLVLPEWFSPCQVQSWSDWFGLSKISNGCSSLRQGNPWCWLAHRTQRSHKDAESWLLKGFDTSVCLFLRGWHLGP